VNTVAQLKDIISKSNVKAGQITMVLLNATSDDMLIEVALLGRLQPIVVDLAASTGDLEAAYLKEQYGLNEKKRSDNEIEHHDYMATRDLLRYRATYAIINILKVGING
jgi:hypothetical protein